MAVFTETLPRRRLTHLCITDRPLAEFLFFSPSLHVRIQILTFQTAKTKTPPPHSHAVSQRSTSLDAHPPPPYPRPNPTPPSARHTPSHVASLILSFAKKRTKKKWMNSAVSPEQATPHTQMTGASSPTDHCPKAFHSEQSLSPPAPNPALTNPKKPESQSQSHLKTRWTA